MGREWVLFDIGVALFTFALGWPVGLTIGISYLIADKFGAFDSDRCSSLRLNNYIAMPDATRVAPKF